MRGTATAASIWNTAAVSAVAYSDYDIAIMLSVANFVVLRWLAAFKAESTDAMASTPVDRGKP